MKDVKVAPVPAESTLNPNSADQEHFLPITVGAIHRRCLRGANQIHIIEAVDVARPTDTED
jgi:hypothetical protein